MRPCIQGLCIGIALLGMGFIVASCSESHLRIDDTDPQSPIFHLQFKDTQKVGDITDMGDVCIKLLSVYRIKDGKAETTPVIGDYSYANGTLSFTPKFRLGQDLRFEIRYGEQGSKHAYYTVKKKDHAGKSPPQITRIFPLGDTVPANILTFYIAFDRPMVEDIAAYRKVKVLDSLGQQINKAWREKSYWINNGHVLVLMIHPGRVKRSIRAAEGLGPVFREGANYSLFIEPGFKDTDGRHTDAVYEKHFFTAPDDRSMPVFYDNLMHIPVSNTRDPLSITFSEVMDYGLMWKWTRIIRHTNDARSDTTAQIEAHAGAAQQVKGYLHTKDGTTWDFVPLHPWPKGTYTLLLRNKIADVTHNQLDRPFEVTDKTEFTVHKDYRYPFTVR